MAGEPSLFLVYQRLQLRPSARAVSWHGTQAAADDAATNLGAGFTAHQGAVTVPGHFRPGLIYNPTDDTWRDLAVSDLDELGQRKAAATALYAALNGQEGEIGQRMGIPAQVRGRVQDILAYARWACLQPSYQLAPTWTADAADSVGDGDA